MSTAALAWVFLALDHFLFGFVGHREVADEDPTTNDFDNDGGDTQVSCTGLRHLLANVLCTANARAQLIDVPVGDSQLFGHGRQVVSTTARFVKEPADEWATLRGIEATHTLSQTLRLPPRIRLTNDRELSAPLLPRASIRFGHICPH